MCSEEKLFAIGDLHLDSSQSKPMSVFGSRWENHRDRLRACWMDSITHTDVVLLPGDISWAMRLSEADLDLSFIADLPGRKVLLRGNHDFWWSSIGKVRSRLPQGMFALQNDAFVLEKSVIAGSRGWLIPTKETPLTAEDEKVYIREVSRMELSLEAARLKGEGRPIIVMMHYPPIQKNNMSNGFTNLFSRYKVQKVVFGHIHNALPCERASKQENGVTYQLVSADSLDFMPFRIY